MTRVQTLVCGWVLATKALWLGETMFLKVEWSRKYIKYFSIDSIDNNRDNKNSSIIFHFLQILQ